LGLKQTSKPAAQAILKLTVNSATNPKYGPTWLGAPFCMFNREPLNLPFLMGGLGHGARAHVPNEYIVVGEGGPTGGLITLEKSYVTILDDLSKML